MSGWTFLVGLSLVVLAVCLGVIAWTAWRNAYRGDHRPPQAPPSDREKL